jgi:hypothetical protein
VCVSEVDRQTDRHGHDLATNKIRSIVHDAQKQRQTMQRPDFIQGAKLHVRTLVFHNRLLFSSLLLKKPVWFSIFLSRFSQSGKRTHQFFISLSCLIFFAQNRGQFAAVRLITAYRAEHKKMLSKSLNAKITFSLATSKSCVYIGNV